MSVCPQDYCLVPREPKASWTNFVLCAHNMKVLRESIYVSMYYIRIRELYMVNVYKEGTGTAVEREREQEGFISCKLLFCT